MEGLFYSLSQGGWYTRDTGECGRRSGPTPSSRLPDLRGARSETLTRTERAKEVERSNAERFCERRMLVSPRQLRRLIELRRFWSESGVDLEGGACSARPWPASRKALASDSLCASPAASWEPSWLLSEPFESLRAESPLRVHGVSQGPAQRQISCEGGACGVCEVQFVT